MNSTPGIIESEPIAAANWLNRLRSSKGFPLPKNNLTLDHYLLNNDEHRPLKTPESARSNEDHKSERRFRGSGKVLPQWTEVQFILSDLFNVGCGRPAIKAGRKQANPRCFQSVTEVAENSSSQCAANLENALASTVSLNSSPGKANRRRDEEDGGAGEESGWRGYSRSEVTIIDTSCEGWKFNKVLYRKKDTWKVRDLKERSNSSISGGLKKKKVEMDEIIHVKKKKKKQKMKPTNDPDYPSEGKCK